VDIYGISIDKQSGNSYVISELVEGGNLKTFREQALADMQCMERILMGIVNGMIHLHAYGIVHRDLAMRNVLVDPAITIVKLAGNPLGHQIQHN